jgi:hypothetical protein
MPLPPGPPREWRPLVDMSLATFNGVSLMMAVTSLPSRINPFTLSAVLALVGFLGRGHRRLRACLVLPSGLLWLLTGLTLPIGVLVQHGYAHRQHPPIPIPWLEPIALAFVFVVAGALTIESAIARMRRS